MTLSEFLMGRIKGRGWSQRHFASVVGISATEVTDILMKGHIPGDKVLQRISHEMKVSMAYLHQISGYSWMEPPEIRHRATELARVMDNSPLLKEFWEEAEDASVDELEKAISYLRYLKAL